MRAAYHTAMICLAAGCNGEVPAQADAGGNEPLAQWALPNRLSEISGLALTDDERLLAVTDEEAIVYELDYRSGRLVKAFALGEPTLRGDFEGIAVLHKTVWLMTSNGDLYRAEEGADGERVGFARFRTGLDKHCELEGLAGVEARSSLAMVCKNAKKKLRVFEWAVTESGVEESSDFALPEKAMEKAIGKKRLNPSGIELDPGTGNWIIVAAQQHALFEVSPDGELIEVIMEIDKRRHRQAEGIAITNDGRVLIADEASNGRASLAVYELRSGNNKN